jgi:hypothetical protein
MEATVGGPTKRQGDDVQESTASAYGKAQLEWAQWCGKQRIVFPATHDEIARYLLHVCEVFGPNAVQVHQAAVARHYRNNGLPFDARSKVIRNVSAMCRALAKHQRAEALKRAAELAERQGDLLNPAVPPVVH